MRDLHDLPKIRDSISFLYVEHCVIEKEHFAIAIYEEDGKTHVPVASLTLLMLGPGTKITHAAIQALAENGCTAIWCGEEGVRTYACGTGETRSAEKLIRQAVLVSDETKRILVARRMYMKRFREEVSPDCTIEELRGKEGMRVRTTYENLAEQYGIEWKGRSYNRQKWTKSDIPNRALSAANSCLYGICHAAIVSLGYSPALGFIHTGQQLSFVFDIADLYKTEICIPIAFKLVSTEAPEIERSVRLRCRDMFRKHQILKYIADDIEDCLNIEGAKVLPIMEYDIDSDPQPTPLWEPKSEKKSIKEADNGSPDS